MFGWEMQEEIIIPDLTQNIAIRSLCIGGSGI